MGSGQWPLLTLLDPSASLRHVTLPDPSWIPAGSLRHATLPDPCRIPPHLSRIPPHPSATRPSRIPPGSLHIPVPPDPCADEAFDTVLPLDCLLHSHLATPFAKLLAYMLTPLIGIASIIFVAALAALATPVQRGRRRLTWQRLSTVQAIRANQWQSAAMSGVSHGSGFPLSRQSVLISGNQRQSAASHMAEAFHCPGSPC